MISLRLLPLNTIGCLLWFCVLYCHIGYAQTAKDTLVASQYFSESEVWYAQKKPDSAIVYYNKALSEFAKINNLKRVADCYAAIAKSHKEAYNFDIALLYAQTSLGIRLQLFSEKDPEIATSYTGLGHILKAKDQYQDAMSYYQKALDIRLHVFGENNHHVGNSYRHIGTIHHVLAQYDKALSYYTKALYLQQQTYSKTHPNIAETYIDFGTTYYHLGKNNKALSYYQKALKINSVAFGDHSPEVGLCYNHIGNILLRLDKFEKAIESHKKAISILSKTYPQGHPDMALLYESIGVVYGALGEHDIALKYFNKGLKIVENKLFSNSVEHAELYIELGFIFFKNGNYNKSLSFFNKTLNIVKKVFPKKHPFIGITYNNMGLVYEYEGRYDEALLYYTETVTNYLESLGRKHTALARTYNNMANVYKAIKSYDLALIYYQKALDVRVSIRGGYHSDTSYSYVDIADVYVVQKEYSTALGYYEKALQIQKKLFGEVNYYVADIYNRIATVYTGQKEYATALEYLHKSMDIRLQTDGAHHPRTAKSYNQIAKVYCESKDYEKAISYYDQAILANIKAEETLVANQFDVQQYIDLNVLLRSLQYKAKVLQEQYIKDQAPSHLVESIALYQKADNVIHAIRQGLHTHEDKLAFATQIQEVYSGAIQSKLLQYKKDQQSQSLHDAFYYAEKSKANTLQGLLAASNAKKFAGLPKTILEVEQGLKAERAVCTSELMQQRSETVPDTTKIATYENRLFDIARKQDSLTRVIEQKYPKYYELKHKDHRITVADIQKKMDKNITLLEYFYTEDRTYVFAITKNDLNIASLSTPNLIQDIEQLRVAITTKNTTGFKRYAHQLYNQLIAPVQDYIKGDQLVVIPDGPLWYLNFELLCIQNDASNNPKELSYMLKKYAISYANSVKLLMIPFVTDQGFQQEQECLAFSFSDTDIIDTNMISLATLRDSKEDLPGTRKEIKAIADIIDGKYYFGSQAIEHNFKRNAANYSILHLALHGEVDNEHPEKSRLLFTKEKDTIEDNYLYGHELFAMNIPAELTVLSACNTGTGKIAKGEGIMSLGNAFQYAGTKSLVLSSWEVSDRTTPELMKYFYSYLKKGMNKSKALQQAKLQYLNSAHINRTAPFYWGGFYLVGDHSPIDFDANYTVYWVLGIMAVGILFFGLIWYQKKHNR
ncbi:CHAT domain-containing protein [Aquimarina aquimarini]|uniref:CHAT domain-containing protein n=1 Tax=Aquimarina aquimarini TaxID=1191734 RepID=UPI000D55C5E1|nr:CHAT domain-containing protein [Aquimarina aquimarini]